MINKNLLYSLFDMNHTYDYDKIESPIEEFLLNHIVKFLHENTRIIVQYPIATISGNFRADIALKNEDKLIIIECDGEEYHTKEKDDWYDEWRDTLILIQKKAQVIYRIKGNDIYNNLNLVFAIINFFDTDLFNDEYSSRLEKIIIEDRSLNKHVHYNYHGVDGRIIPSTVAVKRRDLVNDFDNFWFKYVMYSLLNPDKTIFELIEIMSSNHYEFEILIKKINEKYPNLRLENMGQLINMYK